MHEAQHSHRNRRRKVTVRVPADHPPTPARGPPPTASSDRLGDAPQSDRRDQPRRTSSAAILCVHIRHFARTPVCFTRVPAPAILSLRRQRAGTKQGAWILCLKLLTAMTAVFTIPLDSCSPPFFTCQIQCWHCHPGTTPIHSASGVYRRCAWVTMPTLNLTREKRGRTRVERDREHRSHRCEQFQTQYPGTLFCASPLAAQR